MRSCFALSEILIGIANGFSGARPELELELIETQMAQKPMLRAEVGMRVRCANKASANDSGGRGALAKFLIKFAKSEEFVGVAHSAERPSI